MTSEGSFWKRPTGSRELPLATNDMGLPLNMGTVRRTTRRMAAGCKPRPARSSPALSIQIRIRNGNRDEYWGKGPKIHLTSVRSNILRSAKGLMIVSAQRWADSDPVTIGSLGVAIEMKLLDVGAVFRIVYTKRVCFNDRKIEIQSKYEIKKFVTQKLRSSFVVSYNLHKGEYYEISRRSIHALPARRLLCRTAVAQGLAEDGKEFVTPRSKGRVSRPS